MTYLSVEKRVQLKRSAQSRRDAAARIRASIVRDSSPRRTR